jgi:uncharacterized protein YceH (UPF0502 family)
MELLLDAVEARVLGALIEKEITTPEYYPLSANALVNACNQKSSREPVMRLDEIAVRQALSHLEELGLAGRVHDSRVLKFEHHARQLLDLKRPEIAVLCLLLLRRPQASFATGPTGSTASTTSARCRACWSAWRAPSQARMENRVQHWSRCLPAVPARRSHVMRTCFPAPGHVPPIQIQQLEAEVAEMRAALAALTARVEKLEAAVPGQP